MPLRGTGAEPLTILRNRTGLKPTTYRVCAPSNPDTELWDSHLPATNRYKTSRDGSLFNFLATVFSLCRSRCFGYFEYLNVPMLQLGRTAPDLICGYICADLVRTRKPQSSADMAKEDAAPYSWSAAGSLGCRYAIPRQGSRRRFAVKVYNR